MQTVQIGTARDREMYDFWNRHKFNNGRKKGCLMMIMK